MSINNEQVIAALVVINEKRKALEVAVAKAISEFETATSAIVTAVIVTRAHDEMVEGNPHVKCYASLP